jgi:hypothetical protein
VDPEDLIDVTGFAVTDAHDFLARSGYRMRVTRLDGKGCVVTCDYCRDRVNVAVENGVVTEVRGYG